MNPDQMTALASETDSDCRASDEQECDCDECCEPLPEAFTCPEKAVAAEAAALASASVEPAPDLSEVNVGAPVAFRPFGKMDWMAFSGAESAGAPHIAEFAVSGEHAAFYTVIAHGFERGAGLYVELIGGPDCETLGQLRGPKALTALLALREGMDSADLFSLFGLDCIVAARKMWA